MLVAEGSPVVMKIIVSGAVDAIIGVACLNVLEKAIDKILLAGIPCMAVPLLSNDCQRSAVDEDWVYEMIRVRRTRADAADADLRAPDAGRVAVVRARRTGAAGAADARRPRRADGARGRAGKRWTRSPAPKLLAYDFLAKGGKHSRPFITLAVYDALTGGRGTLPDGSRPRGPAGRRRETHGPVHRDLPQGVAGPRRHRGRRRLPLRRSRRCTASTARRRPSTWATT